MTICIAALALAAALAGCGGHFGVSRDKVPPVVLDGFELRVSFTTVAELEDAGFELGLLYEGALYRYRESADEVFAAATYDDEVRLVREGRLFGKITIANYSGSDKPLGDCTVDASDIAGAAASLGLEADGAGGYAREVKLAGQVYRVALRPSDKAPGAVGVVSVGKAI